MVGLGVFTAEMRTDSLHELLGTSSLVEDEKLFVDWAPPEVGGGGGGGAKKEKKEGGKKKK